MSPKISVIIPVYNVEQYLCECLDSIAAQTINDFEVICVDDGSTDASYDILTAYARKDSRFVVLKQKNAGQCLAKNKALDVAHGEYVCFMDPDDLYPNEFVFERLLHAMSKYGCKVAGGNVKYVKDNGSLIRVSAFESSAVVEYSKSQPQYWYTRYLFSRKLIEDGHHRFPLLRRREDPIFLAKVLLDAKIYCSIPELTYTYRMRNNEKGFDWVSDGGVQLLDHIKGLETIQDFALVHGFDKLFIDNIYCLTHSQAFFKRTEVDLVKPQLKVYVKQVLNANKYAFKHLACVAGGEFMSDETSKTMRLKYVAEIFGWHVLLRMFLQKIKARVLRIKHWMAGRKHG